MKNNLSYRQFLAESRRVVVKVGTRVITQRTGRPDLKQMEALVSQIAAMRRAGIEAVLVTSGAVGAGMEALGIRERPAVVADQQMCAAVGQARLMAHYTRLFMRYKILIGQALLTYEDFRQRVRNANAKRTIEHLLRAGVVPVINENDVVADAELKAGLTFGDNDYLAALVARLIRADLLVILSTVDGVMRGNGAGRRRIPCIDKLGPEIFKLVNPSANPLSKGGMDSKLKAARLATEAGCSVVIGNGRKRDTLTNVIAGKDAGTLILSTNL